MVEPLTLVPATWITGGRRRSGWPSAASRRSTRPVVRSISTGWLARRRWITVSEARIGSCWRPAWPCGGVTSGGGKAGPPHHQGLQDRGQHGLELSADYDPVDHAALDQELRALEAGRQGLPDGRL